MTIATLNHGLNSHSRTAMSSSTKYLLLYAVVTLNSNVFHSAVHLGLCIKSLDFQEVWICTTVIPPETSASLSLHCSCFDQLQLQIWSTAQIVAQSMTCRIRWYEEWCCRCFPWWRPDSWHEVGTSVSWCCFGFDFCSWKFLRLHSRCWSCSLSLYALSESRLLLAVHVLDYYRHSNLWLSIHLSCRFQPLRLLLAPRFLQSLYWYMNLAVTSFHPVAVRRKEDGRSWPALHAFPDSDVNLISVEQGIALL